MGEVSLPVLPRTVRTADPLGYVFLGLTLVALGLSALLAQLGLLDVRGAVGLFLVALGAILLVDAAARHARPWTRHKALPYAVLGVLSSAVGLALLLGPETWWPLTLLALGSCSLAYGSLSLLKGRPRAGPSQQPFL